MMRKLEPNPKGQCEDCGHRYEIEAYSDDDKNLLQVRTKPCPKCGSRKLYIPVSFDFSFRK